MPSFHNVHKIVLKYIKQHKLVINMYTLLYV